MKQLLIEPYSEIISLSSVAAKAWRIEYRVLFYTVRASKINQIFTVTHSVLNLL